MKKIEITLGGYSGLVYPTGIKKMVIECIIDSKLSDSLKVELIKDVMLLDNEKNVYSLWSIYRHLKGEK